MAVFDLSPARDRVVSMRVLERLSPSLHNPTTGAIAGDELY